MMLYTVREFEDNKHFQLSFEIVGPGRKSYVLQAESTKDLKEWTSALRRCIENELVSGGNGRNSWRRSGSDKNGQFNIRHDGVSAKILEIMENNNTCADCRAPNPDWASINLGIVICIRCSGVHRSMGSHISQVRSLTLDLNIWSTPLLGILAGIGNSESKKIYEHGVSSNDIPTRCMRIRNTNNSSNIIDIVDETDESCTLVENWIHQKYEQRKYIGTCPQNYDAHAVLIQAAKQNHMPDIVQALCFGADINKPDHVGRSALMAAAASGHVAAVALLYFNGARLDVQDGAGDRPVDVAATDEVYFIGHFHIFTR